MEDDGYAPEKPDYCIGFGPKEWQWLTPQLASMVLTLWHAKQPAQFGAVLAEAMTGARPAATRGK